ASGARATGARAGARAVCGARRNAAVVGVLTVAALTLGALTLGALKLGAPEFVLGTASLGGAGVAAPTVAPPPLPERLGSGVAGPDREPSESERITSSGVGRSAA